MAAQGVRNGLLRLAFTGVKTPLDFQKRFMKPVVKYIIRKHTDGCTFDDTALLARNYHIHLTLPHRRALHLRQQPPRHRARLGLPRRHARRGRLSHHRRDRHRRQPAHLSLDQAAGAHEQGLHRAPRTDGPRDDALLAAHEPLHPLCRHPEEREHLDSPARGPCQGLQRPHAGRRAEDAGHGRRGSACRLPTVCAS